MLNVVAKQIHGSAKSTQTLRATNFCNLYTLVRILAVRLGVTDDELTFHN